MTTDELEARRLAAMGAAVDPYAADERVQDDYFGFAESRRHYLPDGLSWVEIAVMNEGEKRKFMNCFAAIDHNLKACCTQQTSRLVVLKQTVRQITVIDIFKQF